jgi:Ran GTPase-activating protein (RanGAP) involved in mRNA processing and transport
MRLQALSAKHHCGTLTSPTFRKSCLPLRCLQPSLLDVPCPIVCFVSSIKVQERYHTSFVPMQYLTSLNMSHNDIGEQGASALVYNRSNLEAIYLSGTSLTQHSLVNLSNILSSNASNSKIALIDLSRNNLGDRSIGHLCSAISSNSQMRRVILSSCQLGTSSGRKLLSLVQALAHASAASNRDHSLQARSLCPNELITD